MNENNKMHSYEADSKIPDALSLFGQWYRSHQEDKNCLLPQNLPQSLLVEAVAEAHNAFKDKNCDTPFFRMLVGLLKADKQRSFRASREEILIGMHAYALNLILEELRRNGVVTFQTDFSLDNVLEPEFERHIELTQLGHQAREQARTAFEKGEGREVS